MICAEDLRPNQEEVSGEESRGTSERTRSPSEPRPCRARIILGRKMGSEFIGASNPKEFSLGWNEDVENWRWSQEGHFHLPAASFLPSLIPLLPPLHRRLDISFRDEQRWMKSAGPSVDPCQECGDGEISNRDEEREGLRKGERENRKGARATKIHHELSGRKFPPPQAIESRRG